MARTPIPQYTDGQIITASHANVYWKDNEQIHWDKIVNLESVLGYRAAALVGRSSPQIISNNLETVVQWNYGQLVNPASMHSNTTNSERLIAPANGLYTARLNCAFALNPNGVRWVSIWDSTGYQLALEDRVGQVEFATFFSLTVSVYLAQNQYIYAKVYQSSGMALELWQPSIKFPSFSLEYRQAG